MMTVHADFPQSTQRAVSTARSDADGSKVFITESSSMKGDDVWEDCLANASCLVTCALCRNISGLELFRQRAYVNRRARTFLIGIVQDSAYRDSMLYSSASANLALMSTGCREGSKCRRRLRICRRDEPERLKELSTSDSAMRGGFNLRQFRSLKTGRCNAQYS